MPLGIVDEPRLIVEAVGEMISDDGQHIMVGTDNSKVSAIFRLLETDELLHTQLLVQHAAGDIGHRQHISIGKILRDVTLTEHLTNILEQRRGEFGQLREPADGDEFHGLTRKPFLQSCPDTAGLLLISSDLVGMVAEQRQGIARFKQLCGLLLQAESIEHG